MNLVRCQQLAQVLESDTNQLPAFYVEVEQAIHWLMDATFESTDKVEKQSLAATEMRLRLALDEFRKARVN